MRVASRCSASKGTNTSKRSDRYQCALASNVERIEPPQAGASRPGSMSVTTTDALLAGKVQRKVSNGIAGLAGRKSRQCLPAQASCRDAGTRLELRLPPSQLEREKALRPQIGWITGIYAIFLRGI